MKKKNKTTKKDFALFKKEFMKWYKTFGLISIDVNFDHDGRSMDALGWTTFDSEGMVACIGLVKDWEETKITKYNIKKTAFHECMELFLFHIRNCASSRYLEERELDQEFHRVIRTMEEVVFEKDYK